jgi:hypothetical protein
MSKPKQYGLFDGDKFLARYDDNLLFIANPFMSHEHAIQVARWILEELEGGASYESDEH